MKVLGYIMLHYGRDYLEYCLKPMCEVCDKVIILYTLNPSHHRARHGLVCPDSRKELKEIAERFDRVQWVDVEPDQAKDEGEHLGNIWKYTDDYDVAVRADYDEVWDVDDLRQAVVEVHNSPYRAHQIDGFVHFWRSFNCELQPDPFRPVRLFNLREKNTSQEPAIKARIYHFGYAIKRRTMEYKMSVHGHRGSIDKHWLNKWNNWNPQRRDGHFHPDSNEVWTKIVDFDRSKLPDFMRKHSFYNKPII